MTGLARDAGEETRNVKDTYLESLQKELSKYILLHCAKSELSLIDLDSGTSFKPNEPTSELKEKDLM